MSITSRINEMSSHIEQAYDELQGLGAELTNVNKNIENISMVLDDIYDDLPKVSGEGTSLTLDDTRVGKIKSTLKGNTSQSGTPTPSSPIPVNVVSGDNEINICGKNLFDKNNYVDNYYISADGSLIYQSGDFTSEFISVSTGKYIASIATNAGNLIRCAVYDKNKNFIRRELVNGGLTLPITISDNERFVRISAYKSSLNSMQLEKGETTSTYEPYQGNTYNIDLPVENLAELENGSLWDSNGAERDLANSVRTKFISFESGMTITPKIFTSLTTRYLQYCLYDSSKTFISLNNFVDGTAITTSNTSVKYIRFKMTGPVNGLMTIDDINFMVVKGDKAPNNYTPYGTTPIELCSSQDGTKRDYLLHDKTLNKWYWHREIGKVVLNGSETWQKSTAWSTNSYSIFVTNDFNNSFKQYDENVGTPLLSNYFTRNNTIGSTTPNSTGISYRSSNYGLRISIEYSSASDVSNFLSWLSIHNTIVNYILSTPTNELITYQPLIDQLNLLEKAMSKDGQTNISQVNNDLPFIISASALKEWQENTSLNSTLSMVNPLSLGNTLNTQENNIQPIEVDNIEPLEEKENEES